MSTLEYLLENKITIDDLNEEVEYLIPDLLIKNTLSNFYAQGGEGKSFLVFAICLHLLKEKAISNCYYFDMDNSKIALKSRNIDKYIEQYDNLFYIHKSKFDEHPGEMIKKLAQECKENTELYEDSLVVCDSIIDFLIGDITKDKDSKVLLDQLKEIRNTGATVIFLHHTTKDSTKYKGSTAFRNSVDTAYSLSSKRNKNILTYTLNVDKDRVPIDDQVLELNTDTMELSSENVLVAQMTEQQKEFAKFVDAVLDTHGELNQSELIEKCKGIVSEKTARSYLHRYAGRLWHKETRPKQNNATYYISIDKVPTIPSLPNPEF